jgi:hypothetical protein
MAMLTGPINQIRVTWAGFVGGPGISTFYAPASATPDLTRLRAFFQGLTGVLPPAVQVTFPSSGDTLDPTDGSLVAQWSGGAAPAAVNGTGSGGVSMAQGVQVRWGTNEVADGRAIGGRTFLVPVTTACFGADGLLTAVNQSGIQTAAQSIIAGVPIFHVWHRPKYGPKPTGGGPRPIVRTGSSAPITTQTVPKLPIVLTSRRN